MMNKLFTGFNIYDTSNFFKAIKPYKFYVSHMVIRKLKPIEHTKDEKKGISKCPL